MQHLSILFILLNLIMGVSLAVTLANRYRTVRVPFYGYLLLYVIFFNIIVLVNLGFQYLVVNLFHDRMEEMNGVVIFSMLALVICAEYGAVFTLARLTMAHGSVKGMRRLSAFLLVWGIGLGLMQLWGLVMFLVHRDETFFYGIHKWWIFSMIAIVFTLLTGQLLRARGQEPSAARINRTFSLVFMAGYLLFAFDHVDFYFLKLDVAVLSPLTALCTNMSPLVWLLFFSPAPSAEGEPKENRGHQWSLDRLAEKYGLTRREREITGLLCEGRSNKEIEEILFISFSTIKNHLYTIYRKTGINSRSQLIALARQLEDAPEMDQQAEPGVSRYF